MVVRRTGIRARLTVVAVLVVGAGLVAAAALVIALVRRDLTGNAQTATRQRAQDVMEQVAAGTLSPVLPAAGEDRPVVQVVDRQGRVIAAGPELRGLGPLLPVRPGADPVSVTLNRPPIGDGTAYWVIGLPGPDGVTVYAAGSLEPVEEGVAATVSALLLAVPVLIVLVGATTWLLVGRALRPVEAMRAQVAEITASELDRRVPEPATGDELGRLARTMNAMLGRLQQAGARERRFVSDASHELRGPLATIRTRAEVGLAHPAGTDWTALTRDVHREATRLDRLVEELLTLSRADGETGTAPVDLDELVLLEVETIRARGEVVVDLSDLSAVRLPGRPEQLRAMVRNLLDNAERHAAERVTVRLSTDATTALLVVADDGPGIPAADRERVFDRFSRLDAVRDRDSGGTGLGLAIVRDVVTAHGGRVRIADSATGAEFRISLPVDP